MTDWTPEEVEQRRKQVVEAARLISSSPTVLLEDAEKYTAAQYGASWGLIHEMVACFMCRLADRD